MEKSLKDRQKTRKNSPVVIQNKDELALRDDTSFEDIRTIKNSNEKFTSVASKDARVSYKKELESANIVRKADESVDKAARNVQVPVEVKTTKHSAILGQLISYESSESDSDNEVIEEQTNSICDDEKVDEIDSVPNSELDNVNDDTDDHHNTVDIGNNTEPNRESSKSPDSICKSIGSNEACESNPSQDNLATLAQVLDNENLKNILSAANEICDKTPSLVQNLNSFDVEKPFDELLTNPSNKLCITENYESAYDKHKVVDNLDVQNEDNELEIRSSNICNNKDEIFVEETEKLEEFNCSTRPILIFISSQDGGKGLTIDTMDYCSNEVAR